MESLSSYHADKTAISKSGLDKIDSSPLDYWWHYLRPDREGYVKDKQTLFDDALRMAVFEPKLFAQKYVRMPELNMRTNIGKSEYASLNSTADKLGQLLLTASEFDTIRKMQSAIMEHKTTKMLCGGGRIGVPVKYEHETGAQIKFVPHWIHGDGIIVHLMSSKDASMENFRKEAWNFRHDKKAYIQMNGLNLDSMAFVIIEPEPPHKIGIYYLDDKSILYGRETVVRNCETYLSCLASNKWPGFSEKLESTSLPDWAFKR